MTPSMKTPCLAIVLLVSLPSIHAAETSSTHAAGSLFQEQMLSVLPSSPDLPKTDFAVSTTTDFAPSKGPWSTTCSEESVFLRSFHTVDQQGNPIELRVGKGGHLYSIQSKVGELVPPQWRHANHKTVSPWNDEVWQAVAVTSDPNKVFVHQSGCYVKPDEPPFYAPCLAQSWSPEDKSFTMLSWGIVPQLTSTLVSEVLYYTRYRFVAPGVVEVTSGLFDFGKRDYLWLNTPWGGVRQTALGELWIADRSERGTAKWLNPLPRFGAAHDGALDSAANTGGWMAFAEEGQNPNRYAMGLTFGRDDFPTAGMNPALLPRDKTLIRFGQAGGKETRNYIVAVVIPRLGVISGHGVWWRYYMTFGAFDALKKQCPDWADKTSGGEMVFPAGSSETRTLDQCIESDAIPRETALDSDLSRSTVLNPWPQTGHLPVFAFQLKKDSTWVVTTDASKYAAAGEKDSKDQELYSVAMRFSQIRLLGFIPKAPQ